jgi:hypothetical protein
VLLAPVRADGTRVEHPVRFDSVADGEKYVELMVC